MAPETPAKRLLWIDGSRAIYNGLLGAPTDRSFGAHSIYVSLQGSHRLRLASGADEDCRVSVVPPHVRHRIATGEKTICHILIEAETVDPLALPDTLRTGRGAADDAQLRERAGDAIERIVRGREPPPASTAAFDARFFGAPIPAARFDRRIHAVIDRIKSDLTGELSAQACAASIFLSDSRFLHLFTAEVGVPFRKFKTWKRARSFLHHVTQGHRLTDVALDAGYPDATHFSHSIRNVYGLTPRAIVAGSRRLSLFTAAPELAAA